MKLSLSGTEKPETYIEWGSIAQIKAAVNDLQPKPGVTDRYNLKVEHDTDKRKGIKIPN